MKYLHDAKIFNSLWFFYCSDKIKNAIFHWLHEIMGDFGSKCTKLLQLLIWYLFWVICFPTVIDIGRTEIELRSHAGLNLDQSIALIFWDLSQNFVQREVRINASSCYKVQISPPRSLTNSHKCLIRVSWYFCELHLSLRKQRGFQLLKSKCHGWTTVLLLSKSYQ